MLRRASGGAAGDRRRASIERFTRDDLLGYVQRQYSGENVVIGVAGEVDALSLLDAAEAAFGLPRNAENGLIAPAWNGNLVLAAHRLQPGAVW